MSTTKTASLSNTETPPKVPHKRERFALLAQVGRLKKEVSQLHDEADFYSLIATELLALSRVQLTLAEEKETASGTMDASLIAPASRLLVLTKALLRFYPETSTSRERTSRLLESNALAMVTDTSPEGYVTPSMTLLLRNVERAIVATKPGSTPKQ